ncbi:MlaA family lipoprotein, partial [Vibrio parahaemolyticus]
MYNKGKSTFLLLLAVGLVGCSSAPDEAVTGQETNQTTSDVYDPLEGFNRTMWELNYEYLDPYLVRPVSLAYVEYTPVPIRSG